MTSPRSFSQEERRDALRHFTRELLGIGDNTALDLLPALILRDLLLDLGGGDIIAEMRQEEQQEQAPGADS